MSIPKRPEPKDHPKGGAGYWSARELHEHAVAKRAVEALKSIAGVQAKLDELEINHRYAVEDAREALAEIEASGWKLDAALQQGGQGEG